MTGPAPLDPAPQTPATARAQPPFLAGLNEQQKAAVDALDGPVLVLAGAGTGKTRVLTTRLANLLHTGRAWPNQILTVTFTNKAAREMRERVAALVGRPVEGWWLGTFHALAARLLRRHAELVGLKSNFTILDTDDQIRLMKQVMEANNIDGKRWPARMILSTVDRWKDRALTPDKLNAADAGDVAGGRMLDLYKAYQERLRTLNACDFGDLLLHTLTIFQAEPSVLDQYHRQFRYLLVDEYQDTNVAQYLWLRLLARGHGNLCCVGDDDQSIYGWRGAEVGNILRFDKDFPEARIIRLEQNYRSTGHILGAAAGLIAQNRGRLGKTLFTADEPGDPVLVRHVWDAEEEARWVGEEAEALQRKGTKLGEVAVLIRASFLMRGFEERFINMGLPYRVVGGPRFYERQEIRDAMAYLRVIAQPDDDLAFERIINTPRRGIGAATLQTIARAARATGTSLSVAVGMLTETDELKPRTRSTLVRLLQDFERWRSQAEELELPDLVGRVLDESGYTAMWQADRSPEAEGRLENLKEFVGGTGEFDTLAGFLEHVGLVMDNATADDTDRLTLMTLHAAKGLEFDHVFLPAWEEGLFPNQRALDETGIAGLEEERRLAYVGLTRARKRAYVSNAANRQVHGQWQSTLPSRFVEELPEEHCDVVADSGLDAAPEPSFTLPRAPAYMERRTVRTIDAAAWDVPDRQRPTKGFSVGDRVFHQKFGYGSVTDVEDARLKITFDHTGEKKLLDSFVVPADQAG